MTFHDLSSPKHYRNAYLNMYLTDHGFIRVFFQNKHKITENAWRSNQPTPKQLSAWKEYGIKTILNLRGKNGYGSYVLEKEACKKLNLTLIDFRVKSRDMPEKKVIYDAQYLFESIEYPFLMHCKSGADRTGIIGTLFKILKENQTVENAIEQLSFKYLHVKQGKTGMIDFFFETALKAKANTAKEFLNWVKNDYDPKQLKSQFMSQWWANILVDKILNRE